MHSRSHTASVPNLHRAVAECTQPYGPPASVAAVRSLQAYLTDDSCVDAVYRAILARACAEPQSEAVIAKCISLIRQYVGRHPPSAAVLAAIAAACQDLAAALPPSSGVQKSLLYLQSSVTRTADSTQPEGATKRLAKISARSAGSNASSRGVWPHAAANGDLAGSSSSARAAAAAAAAAAADTSVHSSTSEDVLGALQGKAAVPSVWGSADQQQQQQQQYVQQQQQQQQQQQRQQHQQQAWQPEEAPHDMLALAELEGTRTVPSEPVLPSWTFQSSALQELWGCEPEEEADLDWSARAPQLSASLVPLVDGLPGMQELDTLSCQHIVDAITGADVSIQLRQMREITEVRRLQCGVTPELLQQAMRQSLASRSRRLFQPLPYTQQEQADILASDVAAVVEIMCGKPSPTTPSAITGMVGLEDPDTYWQQPLAAAGGPGVQQPLLLLYQQTSNLGGQQPPQQQRHAESIGQISSCILVKMVVDLWLSVGGAAAFPLVLRMLQQALYQLQPQYRARAFDILFNLSLHGSMLLPSVASPPPSPQVHTAGRGSSSRVPQGNASALGVALTQDPVLSPVLSQQQSPGQAYGASGPPSGYSQEDFGGSLPSAPQSPSAAPHQQQQQQTSPGPSSPAAAAAAAAGQQGSKGWSPQAGDASPRARSRLSRSQLGWMGPAQQQGLGGQGSQLARGGGAGGGNSSSSYTATTLAADAAGGRGAAAGMAAVDEVCSSSEAGEGAAGLPIELAWEAWLHQLLFELLLMLSMMDEPCEAVWQSALGCLLHLTTQGGHWVASSCSQLPPAAAAALLDACVTFHWSQELHARLVQMAVNLLYLSDHSSGEQHGAAQTQRSFGAQPPPQQRQQHSQQQQRQREQEQEREGLKAGDEAAAAVAALASPEDVSVTLDTLGSSKGEKQQQQQQQQQEEVDAAAEPAQHDDDCQQDRQAGVRPAHAGVVGPGAAAEAGFDGQHDSSKCGARGSQLGDLDLPWQLHAGPVDEQQLAAFGGPAKLLQHLCHAGSVEAQRTLLVPLLQVLMPPDAPDTAQLAILQALCARPSCLAALQAAVSAGLPGWSGCVVLAVQQQLGADGLDVPLLSCLLLRLEQLSMQRMGVLAGSTAAGRGSAASSSGGSSGGSSAGSNEQQQQAPLRQLPAEVQLALQVTLQQLRGELPSRPQARPGLQAGDTTVYQVPAEVQGSWKALRALCWCDDDLARTACRYWLQQLLAVTLQQSLKGAILLPLPGVQQCMSSPADAAAAGSAAGVAAACEAWSEVLQQLVVHCPRGTDLLVDALQLHMASCKLHMHAAAPQQQQQEQQQAAAGAGRSQQQQEQRQRAAAARECVQAWAFVCQWVMQARVANSQAALTRLAAMAQSMACVFALPEWPAMAGEAAAAVGADVLTPAAADSSQGPGQLQQQQQQGQQGQGAAAAALDASTESLGLTGMDISRDFESGFKGVPPPEPSSEPSALARLWAGTGAAVGQAAAWGEPGPAGREAAAAAGAAAAAAALAAAEGVCWPQAFLTGCAVLIQQMAQVLSGASLALLLVRLLQCRPPSRAGDRGFHGRPSSSRAVPAAGAGSQQQGGGQGQGVMPCPVLYPWSDGRQDLQLGLVLMLISSCSSDAESFAEFGLEAVTQQVLSGCTDPRACLLVSQFMLEHLMQQQQDRYWTALRHLVAAAQAANDERLLGNPFLQLVTLLSDQQGGQQQTQQRPGGG